jgi:hypothetical protein
MANTGSRGPYSIISSAIASSFAKSNLMEQMVGTAFSGAVVERARATIEQVPSVCSFRSSRRCAAGGS